MLVLTLIVAVSVGAAAPVNYRDPGTWLCRPGRQDACVPDHVRTVIEPDGKSHAEPVGRAVAPPADCFYVYPTASNDSTPNSDMTPGKEERGQVESQFAVFASVCRTFAPIYRQVTLTALHAAMADAQAASASGRLPQIKANWELAYDDVKAAWNDYLKRDNHGRPFVLIGHSQGSRLLKRLVAEEIDGKPVAARMLSAILPGTSVLVMKGQDRGGDYKSIPLCRTDTQTSCIVTWSSYRDTPLPPGNALFGRSDKDELEAGCTNPAGLSAGRAALDPVLGFPGWIGGVVQYRQPPSGWSVSGHPIPTRFARLPGLLSAECTSNQGVSYLAIHVEPQVAGDLGDSLTAPSTVGDTAYPEWGWHVMDIPIVQGNLVALVGRQSQAWAQRGRKGQRAQP